MNVIESLHVCISKMCLPHHQLDRRLPSPSGLSGLQALLHLTEVLPVSTTHLRLGRISLEGPQLTHMVSVTEHLFLNRAPDSLT